MNPELKSQDSQSRTIKPRRGFDYICWRMYGLPAHLYDEGKKNINELSGVIQGHIIDPKEISKIRRSAEEWIIDLFNYERQRTNKEQ